MMKMCICKPSNALLFLALVFPSCFNSKCLFVNSFLEKFVSWKKAVSWLVLCINQCYFLFQPCFVSFVQFTAEVIEKLNSIIKLNFPIIMRMVAFRGNFFCFFKTNLFETRINKPQEFRSRNWELFEKKVKSKKNLSEMFVMQLIFY